MPVKWNDSEKLTLLRTAILCSPNFKLDAKMVAEMWPGVDEDDKPSARSIARNYSSIMNHAKDLEAIRQAKEAQAKNSEDEKDGAETKTGDDATTLSPEASTIKTPALKSSITTPLPTHGSMSNRSAAVKSSTGSKRKRAIKRPSSDEDEASLSETTSGDEAEVVSPTQIARKRLPVRMTRRTTMTRIDDEYGGTEEEMDTGAKHLETEGSDGEYDLAKERKEKTERKAKLARRARK
ncbi:uncharacterized protein A1O5_06752 [Cladophialophora psammophila CBS 110553]|uniref:Uncharacterized protein n=1 Tax=Cladophialophora psammophila CBS 110553 TaxID=1182543 RepID=W9WYD9_9EURO|nr:uncharacterized protein A1O5_06752 [Cladophialophora psammophila CBS 110553]EXJ69681.1 hypothetical protein A1O5_06752 [Cladophialophora psammophila CBS 110553]